MRYDGNPEVRKFGEAWRLFGKIAPEPRGILRDDHLELAPARCRQEALIARPLRRAAADRLIVEFRDAGEAVAVNEPLGNAELILDRLLSLWSKFDTRWRGVLFDDLLKAAGLAAPSAPYIMAHCDGGYTTNLPVADLVGGQAMIATHYEESPIAAAHGGPARLLVSHLYFWKSAKWVRRLRFIEEDQRGFWESLGYHNRGDPWREERYDGD